MCRLTLVRISFFLHAFNYILCQTELIVSHIYHWNVQQNSKLWMRPHKDRDFGNRLAFVIKHKGIFFLVQERQYPGRRLGDAVPLGICIGLATFSNTLLAPCHGVGEILFSVWPGHCRWHQAPSKAGAELVLICFDRKNPRVSCVIVKSIVEPSQCISLLGGIPWLSLFTKGSQRQWWFKSWGAQHPLWFGSPKGSKWGKGEILLFSKLSNEHLSNYILN